MRDREHPTPDLLLHFLLGETSKSESRKIVRHLLGGCPACASVLRPIWALGDRRARGQAEPKAVPQRVVPAKVLRFHAAQG